MLHRPNPALWSSGTSLPCVCGALPHRPHPDFVQTSPEETWHRFSAANLCRGKSLVLPLQLTSDNLYYFIFPQNTPVLHYLCLLTRSTCLWHWPDYSIAVQPKMLQYTSFSFSLPTCKVSNPKAPPFTVHARSNVFLFSTYTPRRDVHLRSTSGMLLKQEMCLVSIYLCRF